MKENEVVSVGSMRNNNNNLASLALQIDMAPITTVLHG
jgi:hypothetical protein